MRSNQGTLGEAENTIKLRFSGVPMHVDCSECGFYVVAIIPRSQIATVFRLKRQLHWAIYEHRIGQLERT